MLNNLKRGETYLTAFKHLYESGKFKGQPKVQGAEEKQTKFLDEFLVYPPYEKITEMSLEEQEAFFQKEKGSLNQALLKKVQIIHNQEQHIQNQQEKFSKLEKELSEEKERTNDILNIRISNEQLRKQCIDDAKQKIRLFDRIVNR